MSSTPGYKSARLNLDWGWLYTITQVFLFFYTDWWVMSNWKDLKQDKQ